MNGIYNSITPEGQKRTTAGRPRSTSDARTHGKLHKSQIRRNSSLVVDAQSLVTQPITDGEVRVFLIGLGDDLNNMNRIFREREDAFSP